MWGKYHLEIVIFGTLAIGAFVLTLGLLSMTTKQKAWECRPQPGYCDIDTDWRPAIRPVR
jgi:hypothetical protein